MRPGGADIKDIYRKIVEADQHKLALHHELLDHFSVKCGNLAHIAKVNIHASIT